MGSRRITAKKGSQKAEIDPMYTKEGKKIKNQRKFLKYWKVKNWLDDSSKNNERGGKRSSHWKLHKRSNILPELEKEGPETLGEGVSGKYFTHEKKTFCKGKGGPGGV